MKTKCIARLRNTLLVFVLLPCLAYAQNEKVSNFRPYDKNGINIFETSKEDSIPFSNIRIKIGANFAQQFQGLRHSNSASVVIDPATGKNINQLITIGNGFNLATANLNLDAQLAEGIRLNLITYLSSRHHENTWVKGGYIQFDKLLFLNNSVVNDIMKYVTIKVGQSEVNYGDAHFRRTDNGNAVYNPFVGNLILEAFTTEIGGDITFQRNGVIAVVGITGGETQGDLTNPSNRHLSYLGKLGYDKQVKDHLRLRLTGSFYSNVGTNSQSLYRGDRVGSRYYLVMENTSALTAAPAGSFDVNPWASGYNPMFSQKVQALMINPFIKLHRLELFGTYETAKGNSAAESSTRNVNQWAIDAVYRLGRTENWFIGARYNQVNADLFLTSTTSQPIHIDRIQLAGGWFITKNILAKAEYVTQNYHDFPANNINSAGKFNGFMIEGVVGF